MDIKFLLKHIFEYNMKVQVGNTSDHFHINRQAILSYLIVLSTLMGRIRFRIIAVNHFHQVDNFV